MITVQHEPPVVISGRTIIAVVRITLMRHVRNGVATFVGDKRPIAVICRGGSGEEIFDAGGRRIDADALQSLIVGQSA